MKVENFLKKAKDMAEISDFHNQHVGCVVVYKNKIISILFILLFEIIKFITILLSYLSSYN